MKINEIGRAAGLAAGLLATACASSQVPQGSATPPGPLSVSALHVLDSGIVSNTYVADSRSGLIYHASTFRNSLRDPIPPLKALTKPSVVKQPLDLASQDDDLFVLDGAGPRIVELEYNGDLDEVTEGPWLAGASQLAMSPQGRVAVYATGPTGSRLEIGQLEDDVVSPQLTVSRLPFEHVQDMQFSGEDLVVLDGRQLYTTTLTKLEPASELTWQRLSFEREYRGFAIYRGTYYLIGDQPAAFVPGAELAINLPMPNALISRATRIAVTRTELLFTTDDNRLEQVARPVPFAVEIVGSEKDATAAAVQLYGYLLEKGLMATTELKSPRKYDSLAQLLVGEGWLGRTPALGEPSYKKLNELLCVLNTCKAADALGAPVAAGEAWSLPANKLEGKVTLETASLATRTVQDLLRERFPDERDRLDFTEDYLRRLNNMTEEEWPRGGSPPSGRSIVLPRRKWRLTALVYREDLTARGPLRFEGVAGVRALSLEEVAVKRGCFETVGQEESWEARVARRSYASALVDYVDAPDNGGMLSPIAVAEAPIDKSHPAFCDSDGKTAWWSVSGQRLEPEQVSCLAGNADFHRYDGDTADHGSAISGLIAGREVRGVAGLLRRAKLIQFNVEGLNVNTFEDQIDEALLRGGVKLFNFSNVLERIEEQDIQVYRDKVATTPALFVVAAGNDGWRMDELLAKPLAKFSALKNVLVVGASNPCDDVLKKSAVDEGRILASNWGQLVHLVAPGFGMLAPGDDGGYTEIGGTSLASALVTAAAGNLLSRMQPKNPPPSAVKARLMYTADWSNQYIEDEVIGGRLNVRRAVSHLDSYLVRTGTKQLFEIKPDFSRIPWLNGRARVRGQGRPGGSKKHQLKWEKVLRLTNVGGLYRVVFLDESGKFEIVNGLDVDAGSNAIPCSATEWSEESQTFKPTLESAELCAGEGLRTSNIMDFVAPVPSGEVNF